MPAPKAQTELTSSKDLSESGEGPLFLGGVKGRTSLGQAGGPGAEG